MKLVIEINKEHYERIMRLEEGVTVYPTTLVLYEAIKSGTPLPKGHGRLISEPTKEEIAKTVGGQNDFAECIRDSVKAVFDNAPTIIEADKCEEDDKYF